jgi:glycosyltransferase involved in cell wall biosynthesis
VRKLFTDNPMLNKKNSSLKEFKSIVIITQYFPPEVGGGAMRASGIAESLHKLGVEVHVIAPQPSYMLPSGKRNSSFRLFDKYEKDGIIIYRPFAFATARRGFLSRLMYYISFSVSSIITSFFCIKDKDVVLTISPPLFTGVVGVFIKRMKKSKLVFDIGDLWPETAIKLGFLKTPILIKLAQWLEKWIYKNSDAINVVTEQTKNKLSTDFPELKNVFYVPNFVNTELILRQKKDEELCNKLGLTGKIVFGYAGNIGGAQGIQTITLAAQMLKFRKDIVFLIIGDGIEKILLDCSIKENCLENVISLPTVSQNQINHYYSLFDFSIIPLVRNDLFKMTIPSKLYECMAAEIPIILCVDGEAREIIHKAEAGYFVEPEDHKTLSELILKVVENIEWEKGRGVSGRCYVKKYFERDNIVLSLKKNIESEVLL